MQETKLYMRLNVVGGLLLIALGILHGMFLAADRDFEFLDQAKHLMREGVTPTIARSWVNLAHAHWGVLGIANIAIGIVLPMCLLTERRKAFIGWLALLGGALVPLGFVLWLVHPALIYMQLVGTVALLIAIFWTAWGATVLR